MVSYCKLVGVKSFVFEIKSCKDVPVNLHQMNGFFLKFNIYLFGCIGSYLWHARSLVEAF